MIALVLSIIEMVSYHKNKAQETEKRDLAIEEILSSIHFTDE